MSAQQGMQTMMETTTLIKFEPSKLSISVGNVIDDCLSLEENNTQCTEDASDESSQSGNHFGHLENISRPTNGKRSSFKGDASGCSWKGKTNPNLAMVRQLSDLSVMSQAEAIAIDHLAQSSRSLPQAATAPIDQLPHKRSVSFNEIHLRFYDQCLGDHPSTSYGPPIALDWKYEEAEPIAIDEYEGNRGNRRTLRQLMVNYYARKNLLMWAYGYSEDDLKKATKEANKTAFKRGVTRYFLGVSKVEEVVRSAGRKAKRVVVGKKQ
jgi:hypothetical protein